MAPQKSEPPPPPPAPAAPEGVKKRLTKLLRGVTLLLALAIGLPALAATVLGFGGAAWWGLDLLSHFRIYYTIILAGALFLTILTGYRWWTLAMAIPLGINVILVAPLYWPQQAATDPPTGHNRLRLLHFNVLSQNQSYDEVIQYLEASGAEVVFLQEVTAEWLEQIQSKLDRYEVRLAAPRNDNFGIAMLVRRDAADWLAVAEAREFDVTGDFAQVPAIETLLKWGDKEVVVLSLHAFPPLNYEAARIRDAQLASTAWWVTQQTRPVVVIGDLNATPWSIGYQEMVADCSLVSSQNGFGLQGTFPADKPIRIPIDHCLHSPALVTLDRRIGPDLGSDHRPLKVTLAWRSSSTFGASTSNGFQLSSWLPWLSGSQ